jgi:hypothetical protein
MGMAKEGVGGAHLGGGLGGVGRDVDVRSVVPIMRIIARVRARPPRRLEAAPPLALLTG